MASAALHSIALNRSVTVRTPWSSSPTARPVSLLRYTVSRSIDQITVRALDRVIVPLIVLRRLLRL
jgi:hypothetical protein